MTLIEAANKGDVAAVERLLKEGADIERRGKHGWTPLMLAAKSGHIKVLQLLLDKGADITARDTNGLTALMHASANGHIPVVKILLDQGEDIESNDHGSGTPLMFAANWGHPELVKFLLDSGADIENRDERGWTALTHASVGGHIEVVKFLLGRGADIGAKDNEGSTPLMCAATWEQAKVVDLLKARGASSQKSEQSRILTLIVECVSGTYLEDECARVIEIEEDACLYDLHEAIQDAVEFGRDHPFEFFVANSASPREERQWLTYKEEWEEKEKDFLNTGLNSIYPLGRKKLYYLFDFGDQWTFEIRKKGGAKKPETGVSYPRLLQSIGLSPEQYPRHE